MALVSLQNVRLAFGGPEVLDGVSFQIGHAERVCLVGRNGEGKSTLLKVIAGRLTPDSGEVVLSTGVRITYLSQEVEQGLEGTVFEVVSSGLGSIVDRLSAYRSASHRLADEHSPSLLAELERLQHEIESSGGWQIHRRVEAVLTRTLTSGPSGPARRGRWRARSAGTARSRRGGRGGG